MRFFICLAIAIAFVHFNISITPWAWFLLVFWGLIAGFQDVREIVGED